LENNTYRYGSYDVDIDIDYYKNQANDMLSKPTVKLTGLKHHNYFCSVPANEKEKLREFAISLLGKFYDWNFDYFHSGEPVGLHTDYDTIAWNDNIDCHVVVGIIIPLEWNCKQPYTINYNRVSEIPRKLMYRDDELRYRYNDEIFPYRSKWEYDDEVKKYNPTNTYYAPEYADLKIDSVYEWKIGTAMVFDTARLHSSSWFLSTKNIPDVSTEWKRSIIGFGSIDVHRN
jgi:hypothetical protein